MGPSRCHPALPFAFTFPAPDFNPTFSAVWRNILTAFAANSGRLLSLGSLQQGPYNKALTTREDTMSFAKNPGRFAGLLYVLTSIPGFFAIEYVPGKLIVHGNAAATANNIATSETLFRLGIAAQLISQAGFIFVALALYHLLKGVNRRHASLMVTLVVVQIPIAFLNELNSIAALALVRGADFLSIFEKPQREALAMLSLNLHHYGFVVAEIFWGLWLLPLALLVYRSRFLPRFLGVWLVLDGLAYVTLSLTEVLLPQYSDKVFTYSQPAFFGEVAFMLWLLIKGARAVPTI
jgi:hypothetical protein